MVSIYADPFEGTLDVIPYEVVEAQFLKNPIDRENVLSLFIQGAAAVRLIPCK